MAVIETSKLFDEYFKNKSEMSVKKSRSQVDRPEVYEFEEKIGKQLVDMDVDELFEMLGTFRNNCIMQHGDTKTGVSFNSYVQISSSYRDIFEFYINKFDVVKNPWNDKRMRGSQARERLAQMTEPFTLETVQKAINKVHGAYDSDKANYIECIILLFYEGFARAEEIVSLKEDMIDFKTKEVWLQDRVIKLSGRCFLLLNYVHNMEKLGGVRYDFLMKSYRGGYFKFAIRSREEDSFDDRPVSEIANMINRRLIIDVRKRFSIDINYRNLYLLGFYHYLVETYGEEHTREIIVSLRDLDCVKELMDSAKKYGIIMSNTSHLKRYLRPFI